MGRVSMEEEMMSLFFDHPSKQWHFSQIKKEVPISDSKISKWLKKFVKEEMIRKIKPKKKMPYYTAIHDSPVYLNKKKMFATKTLYDTGFLNHLLLLKEAKTVIIFGSITRGDWYDKSDVDIFIYGGIKDFDKYKYEHKLNREIQVFSAKNKKDLKKLGDPLIKNIIKGDIIKGNIDFVEVKAVA